MPQLERQSADLSPDTATTPLDFDPARYRILAQHWPGLPPPPPWVHVSTPLVRIIARLRVGDEPEDEAA